MKKILLRRFASAALSCAAPLLASAQPPGNILTIEAERIEHPAVTLHGARLELAANQQAVLRLEKIQWQDKSIAALALTCPALQADATHIACQQGRLQWDNAQPVALQAGVVLADGSAALALSQGSAHLRARREPAHDVHIELENIALAPMADTLQTLLPAGWKLAGTLNGTAHWQQATGQLQAQLQLQEGQFSSADGLQAGEKLAFSLDFSARHKPSANHWQGRLQLDWQDGGVYLHPLYLRADSSIRSLALKGSGNLEQINIERADIDLHGARSLTASARVHTRPLALVQAQATLEEARLDVLGEHWLAPLLFSAAPDNARFGGRVDAEIKLDANRLSAFDARLEGVSFAMPKQSFTIGPVSGHIPWQPDRQSRMALTIDGGRWHKLDLGAFSVHAHSEAGKIAFEPVAIPVLDSHLHFSELSFARDAQGRWHGQGAGQVDAVDMQRLSRALDLPEMHGVLGASIPRLSMDAGEIALDGQLAISVFDGTIVARQLRVIEPFGTSARLLADLDAYQLDLFQLSQTFSFGSIQGLIDAHVHHLELVDWQPVAFDARIVSSKGDYKKRISQRAVQNITALGGAGAMAALQRGILGFFEHFQYRRINLGCTLANNVCTLAGKDNGDGKGVVLIEGGGIPALNVIGYNRHIDWPEFLQRLQRVTAGNQSPVIQ